MFIKWVPVQLLRQIVCIICAIGAQNAYGFVAVETDLGTLELRSHMDRGLEIVAVANRLIKNKDWIYFCVADVSTGHFAKARSQRCFYGQKLEFRNIYQGQIVISIEHGLKGRIFNDHGLVPIGNGRYFYSANIVHLSYREAAQ